MITHLEPDILECEVKQALGSITMNKASGGDGIQVELFQILKDDVVKVLHSICQQIWKTQELPQDWKRLVYIPIPKKGNAKECSNYHTIALISHASKWSEVKWSEIAQSCPILCDPMNCSLPCSSIYGIFQAKVLKWVAISFSKGSSQPRDQTPVSRVVGRRFTVWATREAWYSIEWERLVISSRKLEISKEHFMQRWAQWKTEVVWT